MSDPFEGLFDSGEVLERVGVNLTTQARRGDLEPVRCRDAEIARVVDILLRQSKNNPALIGKAGVGKTAIVEGLAQRVAAGDVPPALKEVRVVALDHVALLAGTTFRGQYEERIRKLVRELSADPDLILFVDELHNLIGQGTALGAAMDAANMLKPALVRGDIRIIGATTGGEYDKWIRGDPALERRFQPVLVEDLDAIQTWEGEARGGRGRLGEAAPLTYNLPQPPPTSTNLLQPWPSVVPSWTDCCARNSSIKG